MRAVVKINKPVYGEWVNRAGVQDRPFKGWQPLDVEVELVVSKFAGIGYIYKEEYVFKMASSKNLHEIESAYKRMGYPQWKLSDFELV